VKNVSTTRQLAGFIAKFTPAMAKEARAALARVRTLVPAPAVQMVYDNFNGLVIGFSPSERPSDAILSVFITRDHITLCFINDGPSLPDPEKLLKGSGNVVRHMRLASAKDLDRPAVKALIKEAVRRSDVPFSKRGRSKLVIRAIAPKQRPRRPQL